MLDLEVPLSDKTPTHTDWELLYIFATELIILTYSQWLKSGNVRPENMKDFQ